MQMGTPPDPDRRPKFVKKAVGDPTYLKGGAQIWPVVPESPEPVLTVAPRLDREGNPLDPEIRVVEPEDELIEVDCAVEVDRADADELPVGNFRPTKVAVTLLDEQYALIQGSHELIYNGDRYLFGYEPESNGLFDVGVYTMIFYALDET